jgi:NAD(P)-dependent dehydrogenase (short-subunit alcohol dehydrogenase family)
MSHLVASELLRPGLLEGVSVLLAGTDAADASRESPASLVRAACTELGANVWAWEEYCENPLELDEAAVEEALERALRESGGIEVLAVDGAGLFASGATAHARDGARVGLRSCLEQAWSMTRGLAARAFLARERGGRIVYIAPPRDSGEHADAARAGLENLARTLSVEWARHSITTVTIVPAAATTAAEVAALTAYLASPAGAYFSGCVLELAGVERGG